MPGSHPHNNHNPRGRPLGSHNKRNLEIFAKLEARGDRDPLDVLSEFVNDTSNPTDLRATCANYLAPYKYAKRQAAPAPRFVDDPLTVPDFQSIEQAQDFLKEISIRAAQGELELQIAADISALVKNWVLSKQASIEIDIKLANSNAVTGEQVIRIEGGLPTPPGMENVIMPQYNGHVIDHDPVVPSISDASQTDSVDAQSSAPPSEAPSATSGEG